MRTSESFVALESILKALAYPESVIGFFLKRKNRSKSLGERTCMIW
jgi:hypothetical protein